MVLTGVATMVGYRSGEKDSKKWCSAVLDAIDNPLERVEYFIPDDLISKVESIGSGPVKVQVRLYPMKDRSFGSRLLDITPVEEKGGK